MRVLIISDVHANLTALEAVLNAAGEVDAVWCLGDLVGYGPDPNECVERISWLPNLLCVKGNHDEAVAGEGDVEFFNDEAGTSIMITRKLITPDNLIYLQQLPEILTTDIATLAHGSPRHPIWEYVLDSRAASVNFSSFDTTFALVGHTHLPVAFALNIEEERIIRKPVKPDRPYIIDMKSIINPGSVGQPRDFDPRASFMILDTETLSWENHRVTYDIPAVQERIRRLGMPEKHALRLSEGW